MQRSFQSRSRQRPARSAPAAIVLVRAIVVTLAAAVLSACAASLDDRIVVPEKLVDKAEISGMTDVRVWGDAPMAKFDEFRKTEAAILRAKYLERKKAGQPIRSSMLALSGGADDGAFGAGLLVGWSQRGDRPEFDLVTGVSAGALIAPFAFLGRDYDRQLSEIFTHYNDEHIYEANFLPGLLGGNAVADSAPLKRLIDKYVDRELLRRVAEARANGRVLLIGTSNIDAERPVYWDLGAIAASKSPDALALFRSVLLASASIPGIFPPVRIAVRANGKKYEELHVDGGMTREVFFSPADFSFKDLDRSVGLKVDRRLYVIRNGKIAPEWKATKEATVSIGARSLSTVLKNQAIGDLIRMYAKTSAEGIGYNLAAIPDNFNAPHPKPFDQAYMTALYETGVKLGRDGYTWMQYPPGILAEAKR